MERRVADLDDGYTRLANMLLEEYAGADLTKRQFKVLLAVLRLTYGWNKPMDRIANSQIAQIARLPEKRVSEARVQLVGMNLLTQVGRSIGP
ncbi:replication protein, partial [Enterobacter hormaechei]|uniref:replication protein n=1 Tax=Enterobacter hormaechei TaxID=158836 RepID=UPI00123B188C